MCRGCGSGCHRLTELRVALSSLPAWPRPGPRVFLPLVPTCEREESRAGIRQKVSAWEARPSGWAQAGTGDRSCRPLP